MSDWRKYYNPAQRRRRYRTDKEFREECRKRSREYYQKNREKSGPVDQTLFKGDDGVLYSTVGRVATLINRSPHTVRSCIRNGVIPATSYYGAANTRRLYSPEQVEAIVNAFAMFDAKQLRSMAEVAEVLRREFYGKEHDKAEVGEELIAKAAG